MHARVAVDDDLGNVRQALVEAGFNVVNLEENIDSADVLVLSGMTQDLTGDARIRSSAAVVNAGGMTAEDVVEQVRERLDRRA
jgi:S-adenosylhomocysteine hydrolase